MAELDVFETEQLVHNCKMTCGNKEEMKKSIYILGEKLVAKETILQAMIAATHKLTSPETFQEIMKEQNSLMQAYSNRYTTPKMREQMKNVGFPELNGVVVNAVFGDEAIDDGYEVFALKDGEMFLLNHHGEASIAAEDGALLVVTPFVYEAEFEKDLSQSLE